MKMIIVLFAVAALAVAAPVENEPPKILRSEFDQQPDGGYAYSYETENGITHSETGVIKNAVDEENKPHAVVAVHGEFSYTNIDGKKEIITYFADETGFHAEGDSIPKPVSRR